MNYTGIVHMSIRAYYKEGGESQYYRDMKISELAKWLEAHTYTHPEVTGYTIQIKTVENTLAKANKITPAEKSG